MSKDEGGPITAWAYILRCADGSYYGGSHKGEDVLSRVIEHNAGVFPGSYTFRRRPVELVWSESYALNIDAFSTERQLKGWTRAKKEALIRGDYEELSRLARSKTSKPSAFAQRLAASPLEEDGEVRGPAPVLRQAQDEG